jgi:DnaK suppressor protein
MVNKKEIEEKLKEEKKSVETELKKFAKKDKKLKGDWDTKFPDFDGNTSGSHKLELEADEVQEYVTLLPIEHSLEKRLQRINKALEKIKKGRFGKCEKCKKPIAERRLKAHPSAELCTKCK